MFLKCSSRDPGTAIGKVSEHLSDNIKELCVSHRHDELGKQKE